MYGVNEVRERHRHRFEFNNAYREQLTAKGLVLSGLSPDGRLVEIVELKDHPWFLATQFHPEYCSRPHRPHPLFSGFVGAAFERNSDINERRPGGEKNAGTFVSSSLTWSLG